MAFFAQTLAGIKVSSFFYSLVGRDRCLCMKQTCKLVRYAAGFFLRKISRKLEKRCCKKNAVSLLLHVLIIACHRKMILFWAFYQHDFFNNSKRQCAAHENMLQKNAIRASFGAEI